MPSNPEEVSRTVAQLGGDLDAMLGEVNVATAVADREGIVRWQNDRWTELAGDCIGRPLASRVAPESTHLWRLQFSKKVLGTARTTDYRMNMLSTDGRHVPIDVSSVAIEGEDHRIVGVFGVIEPAGPPFSGAPLARAGLTARQVEVLHHLAQGHSTAQISNLLGIQPETVRNHVRAILRVLGVHSRLQAVAEARRRGLLPD